MADTQEFLDKLLREEFYNSDHEDCDDSCAYKYEQEQAFNRVEQAILQHFQQEQERLRKHLSMQTIFRDVKGAGLYQISVFNDRGQNLLRSPMYELSTLLVGKVGKEKLYTQVEVDRLIAETRLNLIEYFDQCPGNEKMDWKGLFEDTRKLAQSELESLSKQKEDNNYKVPHNNAIRNKKNYKVIGGEGSI